VNNKSLSEADGARVTIAGSDCEPAADPVQRLLGATADPVRSFALRHWLVVLSLASAVALAAFVVPPLIDPATPSPRHPATAPLWSGQRSPASSASSPATTASESPTVISAPAPPTPSEVSGTRKPKPSPRPSLSVSAETTRRFTSVTVQAENASLSGGASTVDCDTCEGGARVRYVGRVDVHATIPSSGLFDLTVVFETDGKRQLAVSINDGPPVVSQAVTGRGWTVPQKLTVRAALPAGSVDIGLYGDTGNAPDIDAVTIS
jgi:hypothetical protein